MKNKNLEIATIIKNQLYTLDRNLMWGLGATKMTAIECGLRFKVNGIKHKGLIEIVLNEGKDLYEITLVKMGRKLDKELTELFGKKKFSPVRKEIKKFTEVYAEDMPQILERYAY